MRCECGAYILVRVGGWGHCFGSFAPCHRVSGVFCPLVAGPGSPVVVADVDPVAGIDFDVPDLLIAEGIECEVEDVFLEIVVGVLECEVLDEGLAVGEGIGDELSVAGVGDDGDDGPRSDDGDNGFG